MQAQVENTGALEKSLDIAVALDELEADVEQRLKRLARTVKMQGFRPGKVPLKVVAQQYGPQVRQEALGDAVQRAFAEAVTEQKLRVAGYPRIEPKEGSGEGSMAFSAVFEVYPEVVVGDLAGTTIERPNVVVGDAEVDKTVEVLRKQRVRYEPADRAAAEGDQVEIDFRGTLNGEEFQGGQGKGARLVLGEGRWLKDFETAVAGMKVGESKSFDMTFPEDYHAKELAGKQVTFEVTLNKVSAAVLPEVDADFAKSLGVDSGDLATMREEIKANLEREVKKRIQARVKEQAMEKLIEVTQFELPKALLEMETRNLMQRALQDLQARGVQMDASSFLRPELFEDQATRRVKLGLIMAELIEKHELSAKPEQVKSMVDEHAQSFEKPEEVVKWIYSKPEHLDEIQTLVMEDNVVAWVLERAKVADKSMAFDELMGNA
ncbi:MAG: trigger factor [Sulfuricellaceae bacterium]|jgi:trigger factor